jgi:hypothetical protein
MHHDIVKSKIAKFLGIDPDGWASSHRHTNYSNYKPKTKETMEHRQTLLKSYDSIAPGVQILNRTLNELTTDSDIDYIRRHCPRLSE